MEGKTHPKVKLISMTKKHQVLHITPIIRVSTALLVGLVLFFAVPADKHFAFKYIIAWMGFSATFLALSWYVIFNRHINDIKKVALENDGGKKTVIVLIIFASIANLLLLVLVLYSGRNAELNIMMAILVSISLILSWTMVHTIFTFHYAHLYYGEGDERDNAKSNKPLIFPGDAEPDYLDFAYHAFCIGATFQVSDVQTNSKAMRKFTLIHSLISFSLNTFVVALMINILGGLVNG